MARHWPFVINLSNCIIGVSVLAMPFCFKQCGIILGAVLLLFCTWLTLVSCQMLMKAGVSTRRKSYSSLAHSTHGTFGKLAVEISMIGIQLGTLIALVVVIGDLGPAIISKLTGMENTSNLRLAMLIFLCLFVGLPLGLLRNVNSLSRTNTLCIAYYAVLVVYVVIMAVPKLKSGQWFVDVNFWRPAGIFQCLPIFSFAFSCQPQLFILYDSIPDASLTRINSIVNSSINICAAVYMVVGFFGYVTFSDTELTGDVLTVYPSTMTSEVIKLGFVLSIAITFPLVIFPCRASLYTLLFQQKAKTHDDLEKLDVIPEIHFIAITIAIVVGSMGIGIIVPNIEFILGMNGSTIGALICYIIPAITFLKAMSTMSEGKTTAQLVLFLGLMIMLICTSTTLYNHNRDSTTVDIPKPLEHESLDKDLMLPDKDELKKDMEKDKVENDKHKEPDKVEQNLQKREAVPVEKKDDTKINPGDKRQEPPIPKAPDDSQDIKVDKKDPDIPLADEKMKVPDPPKEDEKKELVDNEKKVEAEAERIKDKEKALEVNEQKQLDLLEKLEKQQDVAKQLIVEQKQVLEEMKAHKEEDHKNENPVAAQNDIQGGGDNPLNVHDEKRQLPIEKQQADKNQDPVVHQQIPDHNQQQPVQNQQLVQNQRNSDKKQQLPVQNQQQPGQNQIQPVQNEDPVQNQKPVENQQQPVQNQQLPAENLQPVQNQQQPVRGEANVPQGNIAAHAKLDVANPIKDDEALLKQEGRQKRDILNAPVIEKEATVAKSMEKMDQVAEKEKVLEKKVVDSSNVNSNREKSPDNVLDVDKMPNKRNSDNNIVRVKNDTPLDNKPSQYTKDADIMAMLNEDKQRKLPDLGHDRALTFNLKHNERER